MNANSPMRQRKRGFRLGAGALLALIVGAGIVATGRLAPPASTPNGGRVVFEADAHGKLRRVDAPSGQLTPPPLWKPEPGFLLEYAEALNLTQRQRTEIESVQTRWSEEKSRRERKMQSAISSAKSVGVPAASVAESLKDYSGLSREYDEHRADAWRRSLSALTAKQQKSLNTLAATNRRRR